MYGLAFQAPVSDLVRLNNKIDMLNRYKLYNLTGMQTVCMHTTKITPCMGLATSRRPCSLVSLPTIWFRSVIIIILVVVIFRPMDIVFVLIRQL